MTTNKHLHLNKDEFIIDLHQLLEKHNLNRMLNMPPDNYDLANYLYQAFIMFAKIIFPICDDNV